MRIRRLNECPEILAGDNTRLRELLHPERDYPFSGRYSLAHAELAPGASSVRHRLSDGEVYFILEGRGEMHVDEETALVEAGDAVEIPPGSIQWLHNSGHSALAFLCIVDPAWHAENEEILE